MRVGMKRLNLVFGTLALLLLAIRAPGSGAAPLTPGGERDKLTYKQMSGAAAMPPGPVHNSYFMPLGASAEARHKLAGTLAVTVQPTQQVSGGFPGFSASFFTSGGYLVPTERDIIRAKNGTWDIILSPGRVWSEPGDQGWSRASFPFVLASREWNESHNGIATFLYDEKRVSKLTIQIVQESAADARFDGWAQLPLKFTPETLNNLDSLAESFEEERKRQIPIRPWSDLKLPRKVNPLADFDGAAKHVTVSGLMVSGVLYAQPCRTRYGDYPYCREMRHGVFSVTKSIGGALSLFWLAEKYGDRVYDLLIRDYLDITAVHDGWDKVTFEDTLNMMTGVGENAPNPVSSEHDFEADEDDRVFDRFARASGAKGKLDVAFSVGNYPWGPGEIGRYNTIHAFVLSAAMDAFLKDQEGPDANLWDRVVDGVLKPIGIARAPMVHTREADGGRGIPIMGDGYFPTLGEIARIAQLFHDRGRYKGRQLLNADKIDETLSNSPNLGYQIIWHNKYGKYRYFRSFWLMPFRGKGGCLSRVPEMLGLGGNIVALMPNGMTGIRLAGGGHDDSGNSDGESMARIADSIASFCE